MRFQVGRFACEMSVDNDGRVLAKWLPEVPKYLNKAEREQWQAGLTAFLSSLTENYARPCHSINGSTMQ